MKKLKAIALAILTALVLAGGLSGCCCPHGPEITAGDVVPEGSAG